jgi:hypothetical protein
MPYRSVFVLIALIAFAPSAHALPTPAQLCESAIELASAKYAQCRLNAESKYSKALDAVKRTAALTKCSTNLGGAFTKATGKYGLACAATEPSSSFDDYLKQCSDDATAGAAGASLPDYVGDLASCNANLAACLGGLPPAPVLETGQTTAYGAGSDGDLRKGIAQGYADNGDGTITDTKTGLMWEKKSDDGTIHDKDNAYTWSGASYGTTNVLDGTVAATFLAALNAGGGFAGHTDWRLPNRKELESLMNLEIASPAPGTFPAFNTGCGVNSSGNPGCSVTTCSCTVPGVYWSSSTYTGGPQNAWYVDFNGGNTVANIKGASLYVRAVRGGS